MSISIVQTVLSVLTILVGYVVYSQLPPSWGRLRGVPLPPGPPGHWFFGNGPPGPNAYRKRYTELIEQYGPVVSLRYGTRIVCIVGRYHAAVDILWKHSGEVADRPRVVAANEILSGSLRTILTPSGERLRKIKKALHAYLQPRVAVTHRPLQLKNALNYILDILDKPEDHLDHAKRYAASLVFTLAYGKTTPTSYSDPEVESVNRAMERFASALRPGAYLVDTYPALRYIPGYLDDLRKYHQEEYELYRGQVDIVKGKLIAGQAPPSFTAHLLENQNEFGLDNKELAFLTGSMFGAGSDTTASALGIVTMAAACYPEAQSRVQAQLDQVVGFDRIPTFEDEDLLAEVTAFVEESYRWRPVSAGGFPHRATQDIVWGKYVIPAGATVIGNHWAISRDPDVYPDPETFNPQRWLDEEGHIRQDMKYFGFGFGRRVCPGQHVANNSVFINAALMMWAFKISQDPLNPIDTLAFTDRANIHPLPFHVSFEPRSRDLRKVISAALDA
ncbi:cytochrome P450 [Amylocystis lapponica]|nr:cytochrome P450 [Amylocystis lapponica]